MSGWSIKKGAVKSEDGDTDRLPRGQDNLVVYQGIVRRDPVLGVHEKTGREWVRLEVTNQHPGEVGGVHAGRLFHSYVTVYLNGAGLVGRGVELKRGDEVYVVGALSSVKAKPIEAKVGVRGGLTERERVITGWLSRTVVITAKTVTVLSTYEGRFGKRMPVSTEAVGRRVVGDVGEEVEG